MNIREQIIARQKELGWTNYRLAKNAGLTPSTLTRYLNDQQVCHQPHINTSTLEPLLKALGMEIVVKEAEAKVCFADIKQLIVD